jgi:very-short-patch-repair endonuclease
MDGKYNNHFYNKNLQPYANSLRKEMTKAEACLWKYVLRASKLKGYPFRRQRPVLNYIADFMCKPLMLIIEVDGSIHDLEEVRQKDKVRQQALEESGFTVLRFTNEEVLTNIQWGQSYLEEWIEKKTGSPV